jgi:hypothetical protein
MTCIAQYRVFPIWEQEDEARWVHKSELDSEALPSVMRKIVAQMIPASAPRSGRSGAKRRVG